MMFKDLEEIKEFLKKKGLQPSFQRVKILEFLDKNRIHPTADEIFKSLLQTVPTISKATVYNTLRSFVEKGIVQELTIEENELRYDIVTEPHIHFKCRICGKIYDIPLEDCEALKLKGSGFKVEKIEIYLRGVCPICARERMDYS